MYVLILMISVGMMSQSNNTTVTTQVFTSKELCEIAGKESKKLTYFTVKDTSFVCVKQ